MENIIEKYAQYLEKPDIMGAKILNYAEHLLKSKCVGIKKNKIFDEASPFLLEIYNSINRLELAVRETEFWPRIKLAECNLNQKGREFILISYNSEGFVKYNDFINFLSKIGKVTSFETVYNTFRACRNLRNRAAKIAEYLFLLEKK